MLYADEVRDRVDAYEYDPPGAPEMLARMQAIFAAGYPYLVAGSDGSFAGYACANSSRARAACNTTAEHSVSFAVGMQGRVIGAALLQLLIDDCAARGSGRWSR